MPPDRPDAALLWDMLSHAREVEKIIHGKTFGDFLGGRVLQLAMRYLIQVVGEAANGISREFRDSHPAVPWTPIIKQRQ